MYICIATLHKTRVWYSGSSKNVRSICNRMRLRDLIRPPPGKHFNLPCCDYGVGQGVEHNVMPDMAWIIVFVNMVGSEHDEYSLQRAGAVMTVYS